MIFPDLRSVIFFRTEVRYLNLICLLTPGCTHTHTHILYTTHIAREHMWIVVSQWRHVGNHRVIVCAIALRSLSLSVSSYRHIAWGIHIAHYFDSDFRRQRRVNFLPNCTHNIYTPRAFKCKCLMCVIALLHMWSIANSAHHSRCECVFADLMCVSLYNKLCEKLLVIFPTIGEHQLMRMLFVLMHFPLYGINDEQIVYIWRLRGSCVWRIWFRHYYWVFRSLC